MRAESLNLHAAPEGKASRSVMSSSLQLCGLWGSFSGEGGGDTGVGWCLGGAVEATLLFGGLRVFFLTSNLFNILEIEKRSTYEKRTDTITGQGRRLR